jgi:hypothetical protein
MAMEVFRKVLTWRATVYSTLREQNLSDPTP